MSRVVSGILLPQGILEQPWFQTFTLFVAFNTILYLGLTLAKLVPWPAQIHPTLVRAILPSDLTKDTSMKDIPRPVRTDPEGEFVLRRIETASQAIPLALSLVAGLVVVIQTIVVTFIRSTIDPLEIGIYGVCAVMLIWAQVCSHRRVSSRLIVWSWSVLILAMMVLLSLFGIMHDDGTSITYAIMLLILLPFVAMLWPAALVCGSIGLAVLIGAGAAINRLDSLPSSIAALAAFGAGLVALEIRRNSTDRLLLEEMKSQLLATTDPLTRSLTRASLGVLAPSVLESADAAGQPVHLVMADVVGMRRINGDYGTDYGDAVLIAVSRAVRSVAPQPDLVARWDGDCFVVLGIGAGPDAQAFERAVDRHVAEQGIALGKRPIEVRAAVARHAASGIVLEDLVHRAADTLLGVLEVPGAPVREVTD